MNKNIYKNTALSRNWLKRTLLYHYHIEIYVFYLLYGLAEPTYLVFFDFVEVRV